jgi:hypothetical protein
VTHDTVEQVAVDHGAKDRPRQRGLPGMRLLISNPPSCEIVFNEAITWLTAEPS